MNFHPVGINEQGEQYMKFHEPFTAVERIQLLQRSILVNSFAYYELDSNILTDYQYDANARQLEELYKNHPDEFKRSKYYQYFNDFYDAGEHATSGFDLIERVRKQDKYLYRRLHLDAAWALDLKQRYGTGGIVE